ncbi:hypothetical protein BDY21DRAFT_123547 [Lineolata rhizophorae]|uniref:Uncharacterized protein n=1 Tax=Lineolata rhizophorae TaxID=578093 RepID=A0A6A6NQS7_9PEZI|nr:hypothetical protein BDY21DRAFT_123547 [Lineolata rhizophorae]
MTNWIINHTLQSVPRPLSAEDLCSRQDEEVLLWFEKVKESFLTEKILPEDVLGEVLNAQPKEVPAALTAAIKREEHDISGWTPAFLFCCETVSKEMNGLPLECLDPCADLYTAHKAATIPYQVEPFKGPWSRLERFESTPSSSSAGSAEQASYGRAAKLYGSPSLLGIPAKIRRIIFGYFLKWDSIVIKDWNPLSPPEASMRRRTSYKIAHGGSRHTTTYAVLVDAADEPVDISITAVNWQLNKEAGKFFYGENVFKFLGTPKATLAFIHDRAWAFKYLRRVVMKHHCSESSESGDWHSLGPTLPVPFPRTEINFWREV